jgi:hypothetical protein
MGISLTQSDNAVYYRIYIKGHLGENWSNWLQNIQIQCSENGITLLRCPIVDQAALRGLLDRIFDLGIMILSIRCEKFHPEDYESPYPSPFQKVEKKKHRS